MTQKEKIIKITELFGMKASVAAAAMEISVNTFYKRINDKSLGHEFNEKNVHKLKVFIAEKAKEVEGIS